MSSCSSNHPDDPLDPAELEPPQYTGVEQQEQRSEVTQVVLAVESESRLLTEGELDQVLGYYCGECHLGHPEQCGMNYIDDLEKLVATGKIIPGDGEGSRLVLRMRRGEMPPSNSEYPPVPDATLQRIVDFIDSLLLPTTPTY